MAYTQFALLLLKHFLFVRARSKNTNIGAASAHSTFVFRKKNLANIRPIKLNGQCNKDSRLFLATELLFILFLSNVAIHHAEWFYRTQNSIVIQINRLIWLLFAIAAITSEQKKTTTKISERYCSTYWYCYVIWHSWNGIWKHQIHQWPRKMGEWKTKY